MFLLELSLIKMKSKKGLLIMSKTVKIILIMIAFLMIGGILGAVTYNINSNADLWSCKTEIGLAKSGKPSTFNSCHNYRLVFGKDSAIKYDMTAGSKEIDEYSYSTVLSLVKSVRPDLKEIKIRDENNIVSKEIVYYVIAEEMRKCNEVYFAPYIRSITNYGNCQYSFVCQSCSLFMFDEKFYPKTENRIFYADFGEFFVNTLYIKKTDLTYADYFNNLFSQLDNSDLYTNDKTKTIISKTNGEISFGVIDTAKIYNIMYFFRPIPAEELKDDLNIKDSKFSKLQYGLTGKHNYVQPFMIQIIDHDQEFGVCNMYLNLAPGSCPFKMNKNEFELLTLSVLTGAASGTTAAPGPGTIIGAIGGGILYGGRALYRAIAY